MPVDADVANNLYAALFTDPGGFRHENTTEEALRLGAELVRLGANPAWVALKSYKSRPVPMLKLEGLAVSALHCELDGRLIRSAATHALPHRSGPTLVDPARLTDQLPRLATMKMA